MQIKDKQDSRSPKKAKQLEQIKQSYNLCLHKIKSFLPFLQSFLLFYSASTFLEI